MPRSAPLQPQWGIAREAHWATPPPVWLQAAQWSRQSGGDMVGTCHGSLPYRQPCQPKLSPWAHLQDLRWRLGILPLDRRSKSIPDDLLLGRIEGLGHRRHYKVHIGGDVCRPLHHVWIMPLMTSRSRGSLLPLISVIRTATLSINHAPRHSRNLCGRHTNACRITTISSCAVFRSPGSQMSYTTDGKSATRAWFHQDCPSRQCRTPPCPALDTPKLHRTHLQTVGMEVEKWKTDAWGMSFMTSGSEESLPI